MPRCLLADHGDQGNQRSLRPFHRRPTADRGRPARPSRRTVSCRHARRHAGPLAEPVLQRPQDGVARARRSGPARADRVGQPRHWVTCFELAQQIAAGKSVSPMTGVLSIVNRNRDGMPSTTAHFSGGKRSNTATSSRRPSQLESLSLRPPIKHWSMSARPSAATFVSKSSCPSRYVRTIAVAHQSDVPPLPAGDHGLVRHRPGRVVAVEENELAGVGAVPRCRDGRHGHHRHRDAEQALRIIVDRQLLVHSLCGFV